MLGTTSSVERLSSAVPPVAGRLASTSVAPTAPRERLALAAILLGFAALAIALALTRPPHTDEGHFANAAALFAREGRLAMPMWIEWSPTLDQRMYITPPLYFVALGGWFELFGVSFPSMRLFSVCWGVVLVAAWSLVAPVVAGRRSAALLGAVLVGLNYDVVNIASARYDIMAAALNALALVAYLSLRERHLPRAALVAGALLATSCVVHPYGVFGIVLVASFALTLDPRRLGWREVLCGMAPFVVTLGAWGLYIAQDPAMFQAQFGQNASGRMAAYRAPIAALASELRDRYLVLFGGMRGNVPVAMRAKLGVLLLYAGGVAGCVVLPALRRRPAVRALLVATAATFLMLVFLESNRWYVYLIHIIPLYATCATVACAELVARGASMRRAVLAGAALFAAFTVASVGYRARLDVHGQAFQPALAFLQARVRPGDLVVAGGEFGVGLGFADHVIDDPMLDLSDGRRADWIVQSRDYLRLQATGDAIQRAHVARTLAEYREAFVAARGDHVYRVYARR